MPLMNSTLTIILMLLPGSFFYIMNWAIFIHNKRGKKWVSNTPPLGGVLIAAVFLLTPYKLFALIGLTDPGLWVIMAGLADFIKEYNGKFKE